LGVIFTTEITIYTKENLNPPLGGVGRCAVGGVAFGCVQKGHMAYAEGWEQHGQVRVV